MFRDIIDETERIREKIASDMRRYGELEFGGDIEWYRDEGVSRRGAVGVDSSYASRVYKYIYLYLIRGVARPYGDERASSRCTVYDSYGDAHFIAVPAYETEEPAGRVPLPVKELKKILSHRAKDMEVSLGAASYRCFEEVSGERPLVLLDGSARGFLPYRFEERGDETIEGLRKSWLERIEVIKRLSYRGDMVFVSKTQMRTYLTRTLSPYIVDKTTGEKISLLVPDVIALDIYLTRRGVFRDGVRAPGYSSPVLYEVREKRLREAGIDYITIFYTVLERGGGIYQVSMIGDWTRDLDTVREVYRVMRYWSPGGYPEPLREAHHYSRIRYRDLERLLYVSGVYIESGREVLET